MYMGMDTKKKIILDDFKSRGSRDTKQQQSMLEYSYLILIQHLFSFKTWDQVFDSTGRSCLELHRIRGIQRLCLVLSAVLDEGLYLTNAELTT